MYYWARDMYKYMWTWWYQIPFNKKHIHLKGNVISNIQQENKHSTLVTWATDASKVFLGTQDESHTPLSALLPFIVDFLEVSSLGQQQSS